MISKRPYALENRRLIKNLSLDNFEPISQSLNTVKCHHFFYFSSNNHRFSRLLQAWKHWAFVPKSTERACSNHWESSFTAVNLYSDCAIVMPRTPSACNMLKHISFIKFLIHFNMPWTENCPIRYEIFTRQFFL